MAASLKSRLEYVLGGSTLVPDDASFNLSLEFEEALWSIASILPTKMLLREANEQTNDNGDDDHIITIGTLIDGGTFDHAEDSTLPINPPKESIRILAVRRYDTATSRFYGAQEIDVMDSDRAKDAGSIYYATTTSPVYWSTDENITIAPSTGAATYNYWSYDKEIFREYSFKAGTDSETPGDTITNAKVDMDETYHFIDFPTEAEMDVIYSVARRILQHKISIAGQDDEDGEVIGVLSANLKNIEEHLQDELTRLRGPEGQEK